MKEPIKRILIISESVFCVIKENDDNFTYKFYDNKFFNIQNI